MSIKKSGLNFIQLFKAASLSSQIMVIVGSFFTLILIIFVVLGPYIARATGQTNYHSKGRA